MVKIDPALEEDNFFIADVCRSVNSFYDNIMPGVFEKQAKKFEEKGVSKKYKTMLIKHNEKPVGFLGYNILDKSVVYLIAFYIHADYQRFGIGKKAINLLIDWLNKEDYTELILLVHKKASWAINFYRKIGFKTVANQENQIINYKKR